MYQRILMALDGSSTAEHALREALQLAKVLGAHLRIIHVVDEVTMNWDAEYANPAEIWDAMARSGRDLLDKAARIAAEAGVKADTQLIEVTTLGHRVPQVIADTAKDWFADLIVLGTHGRRGLSHVLLGSVAEGVMRIATKPVLMIRGE